jgi:hypothetical protein
MLHFYKESLKAIVISGFLVCSTFIYGQENAYFENQPVWHESTMCAIPAPCIETDEYNYYIEGDTVLDGLTYVKLYKQGVISRMYYANNPPDYCSGSEFYSYQFGYLRSENRQMFYRWAIEVEEQMLYDFNLSIGDTLPNTETTNPWGHTIVIGIDSIQLLENYYMRFQLGGMETDTYLIEGIGSLNGLLAPIPLTFECGYGLSCYSQNQTIYDISGDGDGNSGTCMLTVGVDETEEKPKLSLYPNPTTNYSTLQLHGVAGQVDIVIHDFSGRQVRQYSADANREFSFYSGDLPHGIYLLSINQEGHLLGTEKLVVTR